MPGRGENGANPRFVVTSLEASADEAQALYERRYCARGKMENRIKECQLDLFADPRGTIRLRLLKIGAVVTKSVRRIKIAMNSACPGAGTFRLARTRTRLSC